MGHDITVFIGGTTEQVATLRIGGRRRRCTHLYRALGAEDLNAKDSGTGDKRNFVLAQLKKAHRSSEITIDEEMFLQKAIAHCSKEGMDILFS